MTFTGHKDAVEDVQFHPSSATNSVICSVGDDRRIMMWDERSGKSAVTIVEDAHHADIHCLDWSSHDPNLLLTGSADGMIHINDIRKMKAGQVRWVATAVNLATELTPL